jgi:hypothetical protein
MSAWILIPCLVALRAEFNMLNPARDKGADGSIGDSSHTSASDHTPDEDSDVLRDHDADSKNEVHALDIDSTGPWPSGLSFAEIISDLVARERAEYNHPTTRARLKYVIFNRRIASRSDGWAWRTYAGSDPHTNHAHFSALYTTVTEADTRPWGVALHTPAKPQEEDVPLTSAEIQDIADAVWAKKLQDPYAPTDPARLLPAGTYLKYSDSRGQATRIEGAIADVNARAVALEATLAQFGAVLAEIAARPAGGAPTVAELIEALRAVLREGTGE